MGRLRIGSTRRACLADGGAYLATYSGKVILVSREGQPLVVYDIGTCPSEIVDIGQHTYFLTPTRLYVVEDRTKLAAFLDIFQQGRLLVSQSGFGLLTSKRLQWFTKAGTKVGELTSRDLIRAIRAVDRGAVVQTRQHQVDVLGLTDLRTRRRKRRRHERGSRTLQWLQGAAIERRRSSG